MPAVSTNVVAVKIAGSGATSCDGANSESVTLAAQQVTGAFRIDLVLYVVISTSGHDHQVYRSTNDGASWSTYGSPATPTARGGGMCVFVDGASLVVGYTDLAVNFSEIVYLRIFDTVGGTWGSEITVNVLTLTGGDSTIERPEGPYAGYVRLDGSYVVLVGGTVGNPDVWGLVVESGIFTAAAHFDTSGVGSQYSSSFMDPAGVVHVVYAGDSHTQGYHQMMQADNSISARSALPGSLLDWNDTGLGWGFIAGATTYLAVGKDTSEAGIFGRPCIVYGSDAGWSTTLVLDTDPAMADYSVFSAMLLPSSGYVLYLLVLISSDGNHYIIRLGFALFANFNNPSRWTWQTIYELDTPIPQFTSEGAGPYSPIVFQGFTSSFTLSASDQVFRYVVTMQGVDQFVGLLFTASVLTRGNSFRCARIYA